MGETLKIFSDWLTPIGEKDRDEIHRDGDWHESFHCWFYSHLETETKIYFQRRSNIKKDFPNLYDITAAGHIGVAESRIEGGLREIHEELGLLLEEEKISYTGFYKEQLRMKTFNDREICHIYLFPYNEALSLTMNEEVTDVVKVNLEDFLSMISKNRNFLIAESIITHQKETLQRHHFCPHDFNYYQHVIQEILQTK
ncbi:NUDIX domain-containing protein [Halobacillus sp. A5]|uniref:NUDIX hydrolase n=1 Tax=Halobacillus sp. A5 TaxID=2880263 RepID=UPI0020A6C77D|nr:NUDIX domain-containing protein [Halobacillus sp. A5]MCP3029322.1 NUDIX domain-containing protein [Halobacillus sp. A5]